MSLLPGRVSEFLMRRRGRLSASRPVVQSAAVNETRALVEGLEERRMLSITSYSAANDFSFSADPTGVWSYGDIATAGAPFQIYPTVGPLGAGVSDVTAWYSKLGNEELYVGKSPGTATVSQVTVVLPPGVLDMHPGMAGQHSVVRFTVPVAGTLQLQATFTGVDTSGTTTDEHVLHNGVSLADGLVNGYGDAYTPTVPAITVAAGDTIDFTVGYGSNNTYFSDSTSLSANITLTSNSVPSTLTPTIKKSTAATTGIAGQKTRGTVTGLLTASAVTKGPVVVGVYASADGQAADGTLIASVKTKVNLKTGKVAHFSVPLKTLPASLAAGTYTLVTQVTDPAGNTASVATGFITVAAPSIVLSSSVLADVKPATLPAGKTATALLTLTNTGNVAAAGSLTLTYVLSTDPTAAEAVMPAHTLTRKVKLAAGRSIKLPLSIKLAKTFGPGSYFLVASAVLNGTLLGSFSVSLATADPFAVL